LSPRRFASPRIPAPTGRKQIHPSTTTRAKAKAAADERPTYVFQKMHMQHTPPAHPLFILPTCQKNICQQRSAVVSGFPDDGLAATDWCIAPPPDGRKPFLAEFRQAAVTPLTTSRRHPTATP
jgi:hypothetical protein